VTRRPTQPLQPNLHRTSRGFAGEKRLALHAEAIEGGGVADHDEDRTLLLLRALDRARAPALPFHRRAGAVGDIARLRVKGYDWRQDQEKCDDAADHRDGATMDLRAHFLRLAASHGAGPATAQRWWDELEARYSGPDRHYHTLEHIGEMLALLPHADETLLAAVWFHDAVYGGRANEEESAALARTALTELGFSSPSIDAVEAMILATKSHDPASVPPGTHAFLDADLAILGSDRERYRRYIEQVRQEYAHVPEAFFRGARAAILDGFLARPRIYATDEFFTRFEEKARENIRWELSS